MMQATIHNPTNFEPSDYAVEDYLDNKRPAYCGGLVEDYEREVACWREEMTRTFGADYASRIHHCVHCGNGNVRWITAVRHLPTNDVVVFGSDCTERLGFANKVAFKLAQLQARAEARKVRFTIYNERAAFLAAHPAVTDALAHIDEPAHARNSFAKDVLAKLDRYGSLTDKQVQAVIASMARDLEYEARKVAKAAEPKGDAPSGRIAVTGTVLSTKVQEGAWGTTVKMLIKLENNAKVWCTAPAGIKAGARITVKATWIISKDDKSFAFGKRPILEGVL